MKGGLVTCVSVGVVPLPECSLVRATKCGPKISISNFRSASELLGSVRVTKHTIVSRELDDGTFVFIMNLLAGLLRAL